MKVIDFRARPNTPEYMSLIPQMTYTVEKQAPCRFGEPIPEPISLDQFIANIKDAGISRFVFTGRDFGSGKWNIPNEYVAEVMSKYPEHAIGFAGVDPLGADWLDKVDEAIENLGLKGVSIDYARTGLLPSHERFYPLYEKCIGYDVPVVFTMGPFPSKGMTMRVGSPLIIDEVASNFPELKIVMSHGGWPWITEAIGVCYRNENVYVDNSVYQFFPGMDLWVEAANNLIPDKILYASGFPFSPLKATLDKFVNLPFRPEVLEQLLYKNAARLLKLEE